MLNVYTVMRVARAYTEGCTYMGRAWVSDLKEHVEGFLLIAGQSYRQPLHRHTPSVVLETETKGERGICIPSQYHAVFPVSTADAYFVHMQHGSQEHINKLSPPPRE